MTGAEFAALRRAAGLSQSDLARRAGCGRHAVSYWEGKRLLDRNAWAVKRMAEALGLPVFVAPIRARAGWGERLDAETEARAAAFAAQVQRWEAARAEMASRRRVRCGALTRKGASCRALSVPGKRRCKFHGGMSTGARTPEGIERIRDAQRRRWARWRAERGHPDKDQ
ncbi:HGGxSTG domain-containing protein [Salipiger marinus]|uniref:HGGxSTG domain-containing protein n=1 Tax=Salipiger marinus TaxID=555512 RepID=UPI00364395A9